MIASMLPVTAYARTDTVIPSNASDVESALRENIPKTIEINGSFTLNNEVIIGANHTLSISSGSAIYLAGSCKLNIPAENDLTVNGGGKLVCHDTSSNTISVEGNLNLNGIDFEVYSYGNQIQSNGKLTATDCNIKIANTSELGIISFGELKITGGSLDIGNIGDYTTGVFSFSDSPISISDCEVELNSKGKNVTAIQGNMYVKDSKVYIKIDGDYNSEGIYYSEKLIFDNSTVSVTNKFQSTGIHSYGGYGEASEFKIINGSKVQVEHKGSGTGIFISPITIAPTSLIIDDSVLEFYPGGVCALGLNNDAEIQGDNYGKIIFHEGSEVYGVPNKIRDRDVIVVTSKIITVGSSSAPAANNAISEGTYIWNSTHFSNTTIVPTDISFTAVQTGGASGTADSTGIKITFSEDVTGLTEDKISIADGTGAAVKGTLSGSGSNYTISLISVTAEGTINFSIADFGIYRVTTPVRTVNVYKNTAGTKPDKDDDDDDDPVKPTVPSTPAAPAAPTEPPKSESKTVEEILRDVSSHWAVDSIQIVYGRGIMTGTSSEQFSPDAHMNRGMLITALGRIAGINAFDFTSCSFDDVDASSYYAPYAEWSLISNITRGTGSNNFSPDNPVTREELAVILVNFAQAMGYVLPSGEGSKSFEDDSTISPWASEAIEILRNAGIMNGDTDNNFNPKAPATRAEIAAVLQRFIELMGI